MLGDTVESALSRLGVNRERVERWLGRPCRCTERKDRLNALHAWARRVSQGAVDNAVLFLDRIVSL